MSPVNRAWRNLRVMARRPPLAERVRPTRLDEIVGQRHLLGPGGPIRRMVESGRLASMILWGPPGVGKTTLARVLAREVDLPFAALSAVTAGVREIKALVERAEAEGGLLLFFDEIHRLNKAQQDYLLPHVETGRFLLVGATTENPSFEIIPALRSRARVYVLHPLSEDEVLEVLRRALAHPEGLAEVEVEEEALRLLAQSAAGDARRALSALELAADLGQGRVDRSVVREALGREAIAFDKGGEDFYNLISALHKAVRGCHVDAALYYLARLLEGGADPLYVARRLVRIASEDVGLADPLALRLALAAKEAYDFLGSPEGELALAEAVIYLALAPKSNRVDVAFQKARQAVRAHPAAEVPLHLRNAPTGLMRSLGYGRGYAYIHEDPEGSFAQSYWPKGLEASAFYEPSEAGWEAKAKSRWEALKARFRRAGERGKEGKE